jgi:DNA-binding response OmpR family regulator
VSLLLLGLGVLLLFLVVHRRRKKITIFESSAPQWIHNGFDAREISHRVNAVRNSHAAAVHDRQLDFSYQYDLLSRAREAVRSLAFFRRFEEKPEKD